MKTNLGRPDAFVAQNERGKKSCLNVANGTPCRYGGKCWYCHPCKACVKAKKSRINHHEGVDKGCVSYNIQKAFAGFDECYDNRSLGIKNPKNYVDQLEFIIDSGASSTGKKTP